MLLHTLEHVGCMCACMRVHAIHFMFDSVISCHVLALYMLQLPLLH